MTKADGEAVLAVAGVGGAIVVLPGPNPWTWALPATSPSWELWLSPGAVVAELLGLGSQPG